MVFSDSEIGATVQPCPLASERRVTYWIEIVMIGEDDSPVPGVKFKVKLPNFEIVQGFTDGRGKARIENIPVAGNCEVTFPELDKDAWAKI